MYNLKILQVAAVFFSVSQLPVNSDTRNCPKPKYFLCKSGKCIDSDSQCDGIVDCPDGSDESVACRKFRCPPYLFTCKYGACINKNLKCDRKSDCRDSSDEDPSICPLDEASPPCKENEFRCRSGQCIDEDSKCDGVAECDDRSDEIVETCWNIRCPGFGYRCKYGGCVSGKSKCNGTVECMDGSDEDPSICKTQIEITTPKPVMPRIPDPSIEKDDNKPASGPNCILPQHPEFGELTSGASGISGRKLIPGTLIANGNIVHTKCMKGYKLDGNNVLYCDSGKWTSDVGKCLRVCPSIQSTPTTRVTCEFKSTTVMDNCTEPLEGTLARFKCVPYYDDPSLKQHSTQICHNGAWDYGTPKCEPICGQKTVEATPLIVNGKTVTKGDYPWQVAIYTTADNELICGGTLVNQRVILTAAHCVTGIEGEVLPKENYIVAAGKYYRLFNDSRDLNDVQISELEKILLSEEYGGILQNYVGDIAILVTRKTLSISRRVQPVCLDRNEKYTPKNNEYGYVTGWGFTQESGQPSEVLKELKIPSVDKETCKRITPTDFRVYLTYDKICAGKLNSSTAVCRGDSGGGLVFKYDGRYYITGIVSLSPQAPTGGGGCDSQQYGYFTNVQKYMSNFVLTAEAQYRPNAP